MRSRSLASAAALTVATLALALTGCAVNEQGDLESDLAGTLDGAGSSAQGAAQDAWIAGFQRANASVTVNYDPAGSGAGREQFLVGAVAYAGSDAALSLDELDGELVRCAPESGAVDLPVYLSPIVLAFNVDGVDELALDASVIARIFSGELTRWNDPAIAELNPDAALPDAAITAVHRSDDSGTTENFTDFLAEAAGDDWPWPADDAFPGRGEAAQGNSGIAAVIRDGRNVIGYLDASRAAEFDVADLVVADEPVSPTPEAAAAAVDASPIEEGRADDDLVFDLARDSIEPGVYPLVLVSYVIACREYLEAGEGELVREYLTWVASADGQEAAARDAGSAPISPALRERVQQVVAGIS